MYSQWERKKILIWGKTRPELSQKYREIVCTGGVFEETRKLVRIYPVPLRYMDDEKIFKKYQWIEAYMARATSDPRPESYKIRYDGIKILDSIPTKSGDWSNRAEWIINENNVYLSVERLLRKQKMDKTSLGLVKPRKVIDVQALRYSQSERDEFWGKYQNAIKQMELPLDPDTSREIKPLSPPDYRFKISFNCEDEQCKSTHHFSVLDWEIDALYFNLRQRGDPSYIAADKVVDKLQNQVCASDKDLYFFLGNISTHPHIFTIVGLWWPKKSAKQLSLL